MPFTPPATKNGFAFAHGDFFAEVSGRHQHRRATAAELHTLANGNPQSWPAHWFEAQLVHYGLSPCETSSDARRSLLDALNAAQLQVPAHIAQIEAELKEEWDKKAREERAAAMDKHTDGNSNSNSNRDSQAEDARPRPFPTRPGAPNSAQVPGSSLGTRSARGPPVVGPQIRFGGQLTAKFARKGNWSPVSQLTGNFARKTNWNPVSHLEPDSGYGSSSGSSSGSGDDDST